MSIIIAPVSIAVTSATISGVLTVSATTDIWPGQNGWLSKSGETSLRIQVVEILSSTTFRAKVIAGTNEGNFGRARPNATGAASPAAVPGNQFSDLSAFTGGANFNAESQVVATNPVNGGKIPNA